MRTLLLLLGLVLVIVLVRMSFFTVDPSEYVYVTQFGRHLETLDGAANDTDAGLHWRWPWPVQSVLRLDRRLQYFDLPVTELLTPDAKGDAVDMPLTVEAYACWRIKDRQAVDRFIRRIGTVDRARVILGQRINSQLGAAIGGLRMDDLISTETGKAERKMDELRKNVTRALQSEADLEYGIELVDVRLRRFNHPSGVRDTIFERIKSERKVKVAEHQSDGVRLASKIRSEADAEARTIIAEGKAREETIKGQADSDAIRIRNAAHSQDQELFTFLKKMEKLQAMLAEGKSVLLLSTHRSVFNDLFTQPRVGVAPPAGQPAAKGPVSPGSKEGGQ